MMNTDPFTEPEVNNRRDILRDQYHRILNLLIIYNDRWTRIYNNLLAAKNIKSRVILTPEQRQSPDWYQISQYNMFFYCPPDASLEVKQQLQYAIISGKKLEVITIKLNTLNKICVKIMETLDALDMLDINPQAV